MRLSDKIDMVAGIGPKVSLLFNRLGIETIGDLLDHYPRRYEDYSKVQQIADVEPGPVTLKAKISTSAPRYGKARGMHITQGKATDDSGAIGIVWFNQPYRAQSIKKGAEYYLSGQYDFSGKHLSLINPTIELVSDFQINTARVLPVYPETKGLSSLRIRKAISGVKSCIDDIPERLPAQLLADVGLPSLSTTLNKLHFPARTEDVQEARFELGVRELFELSLSSQLLRQKYSVLRSPKITVNEDLLVSISKDLPYTLTDQQRAIAWQILKDMQEADRPLNRLVEGDVGSGKTVIAAMVAANVASHGGQVVVMAPTDLLAKQHYESFQELLGGTSLASQITVLTGSQKAPDKKAVLQRVASGDARIIIGTHAVFQKGVDYKNVQLAIIDEQHRFGVEQRKSLQGKAKLMPHILTMTATPIPRTLGLILYGELDISILSEKPPGKKSIRTELVSLSHRANKLKSLISNADESNQVYIVCPSIDSEEVGDPAEQIYSDLQRKYPDASIGLMHGKLKAEQKELVMADFLSGKIHVLVSTTVIEVGVNVVNSHTIAILSPHRFGLAQLHQLRGRVGRGTTAGTCLLMLADNQAPAKRLRYIEQVEDGFKLSELDLELRGPGAIYGTRQSGSLDLRVANISDAKQVAVARAMADAFIGSKLKLKDYPELQKSVIKTQKVSSLN